MTFAPRILHSLALLTAVALSSAGCAESKPKAKSDGGGPAAETQVDATFTPNPTKEPPAPGTASAPETADTASAASGDRKSVV
jgi:hypothetical protein